MIFGEGRPAANLVWISVIRASCLTSSALASLCVISIPTLGRNLVQSGTTYKAGNAVAGDISLYYTGTKDNGEGWSFGAAVTNLGTKIGYTN